MGDVMRKLAYSAAIGACLIVGWWFFWETAGLTPSERSTVEAGVRARLKDPSSATFDTVFAKPAAGGKLVCGLVNAKNALGGYTGARPFVGLMESGSGTFRPQQLAQDDKSSQSVLAKCRAS